jgi:Holliday junction resolvase RusA-like endonuclease
MISNIAFSVPGDPQGKGRARIGKIGQHARMFTPAKTVAYEGLVALAAQHAMAGHQPFACALSVQIDAWHPIPASWSKTRQREALLGALRPTTKPDIDNIAKAIADGGNGVAWADDKQIVSLTVQRFYGAAPRVDVRVAAL